MHKDILNIIDKYDIKLLPWLKKNKKWLSITLSQQCRYTASSINCMPPDIIEALIELIQNNWSEK